MKIFLFLFLSVFCFLCHLSLPTPAEVAQSYYKEEVPYGINKIAEIENNIYGQVFSGQHLIPRLERLEMDIFNRTYPETSTGQRINNLIYAYKRNAEVVKSHPNNHGKLKSFLNGLSSAFVGTPTGYTPPIYSDPYATPYYSIGSNGIGQHYGQYSDYYNRNGWHRKNTNYGHSSGVHIID